MKGSCPRLGERPRAQSPDPSWPRFQQTQALRTCTDSGSGCLGALKGGSQVLRATRHRHPPSAELGAADAVSRHRGETAVRSDSDRGQPGIPAAQQRSAGSAASNDPSGCRPFLPRGRYCGPELGSRPRHLARAPPNSVNPSSCMAGRGSLTARRLRAAPRSRDARGIFFFWQTFWVRRAEPGRAGKALRAGRLRPSGNFAEM